jgi:hypothetical protein
MRRTQKVIAGRGNQRINDQGRFFCLPRSNGDIKGRTWPKRYLKVSEGNPLSAETIKSLVACQKLML